MQQNRDKHQEELEKARRQGRQEVVDYIEVQHWVCLNPDWQEKKKKWGCEMKVKDPRRAILESESEESLLKKVIQLAELKGWKVYHVFEQAHYAKRTSSGFPDLVMVRDNRLLFAELKTQQGKVSEAQEGWLHALEHVTDVQVEIWRPSHWQTIVDMLNEN